MGGMFFGTGRLTTLDLSSWDTSNTINMGSMFSGATSLHVLRARGTDLHLSVQEPGHFSATRSVQQNHGDGTITWSVTVHALPGGTASSGGILKCTPASRHKFRNLIEVPRFF